MWCERLQSENFARIHSIWHFFLFCETYMRNGYRITWSNRVPTNLSELIMIIFVFPFVIMVTGATLCTTSAFAKDFNGTHRSTTNFIIIRRTVLCYQVLNAPQIPRIPNIDLRNKRVFIFGDTLHVSWPVVAIDIFAFETIKTIPRSVLSHRHNQLSLAGPKAERK